MTHILDYLADRVLLCDGAMGTEVQGRNLDIVHDFHNHENCTEILCESRPDLVREIHRNYLADGAEGTEVQGRNLDIVHDFHNHENCTEILCESRPDLVREIHRNYLAAGA